MSNPEEPELTPTVSELTHHRNPNMLRKPKEQHAKAARLLAQGLPISQALQQAGWTKQSANRGRRAITGPLRAELAKQGVHLKELGRQALADPKALEHTVVGRLVLNAMQGKDDAVQSAKLLGQHKAVNCFQSDTQVGVILIQPPQGLMDELQARLSTTETTPIVEAETIETKSFLK